MFGAITPHAIGNLTDNPQLFFTENGDAGVKFTIACNDRYFDKESNRYKNLPTVFLRCTAWRDLAEHIDQSLRRGMGVIAWGRLTQSSYTVKDTGEKRTVMEMTVDVLGPDLRFQTAEVKKASRSVAVISEPIDDPWGEPADDNAAVPAAVGTSAQSAPQSDEDEVPF